MLKSDKLWKILSDCCHMLILFGFKLSNERALTDQTNMVLFLTNQMPTELIFTSFREFSRACHWLHVRATFNMNISSKIAYHWDSLGYVFLLLLLVFVSIAFTYSF